MSGRRAVGLAALGITWASLCLAVPPLVIDWVGPLVAPPAIGRDAAAGARVGGRPPLVADRVRPSPDLDSPRRVDLYGNEIASPVARYRVDDSGTLYEVHSPQTEVVRLKPPRL